MLVSPSSSVAQKRDLHVGGLGSGGAGAPAIIDPMIEAAGWLHQSKKAARNADEYVHTNPWTVLALVALAGLAAGLLLSQRTKT
jgi:hypothetical protein